ncbi:hypothetical protein CSA56_07585 [candidate division KSB3 bacterium]|uniref:Lipopolysaccharide assembly protein A domain-containing protein n=1 Tax=candidate division KSB3 bacterium TaxID=2044937 RepID=A0A2G6KGI4_9BACT|nr:MAG: hypothetical protein CSA56_07585 [candidate division KSB3 bacterium]
MLLVSIFLVFVLLALLFIVDFVLVNLTMFQTPFDIIVRVPFTQWEHQWGGVLFMYIIAGSVLLGALVIVLSIWAFDTRRKLKIRGQRKELKRLKQELQEAKAALPQEEPTTESNGVADESEESPTSATPEQVSKSFENVVEGGDVLEDYQPKKMIEDAEASGPSEGHAGNEQGNSEDLAHSQDEQLSIDDEKPLSRTPVGAKQASDKDERRLPQAIPVEAEVVNSEVTTSSSEQADTAQDENSRSE